MNGTKFCFVVVLHWPISFLCLGKTQHLRPWMEFFREGGQGFLFPVRGACFLALGQGVALNFWSWPSKTISPPDLNYGTSRICLTYFDLILSLQLILNILSLNDIYSNETLPFRIYLIMKKMVSRLTHAVNWSSSRLTHLYLPPNPHPKLPHINFQNVFLSNHITYSSY